MGFGQVFCTLAAVFAPLLCLTVGIFQKTFNASMRRGSGARPRAGHRNAALDTTPLLKQDSSSLYRIHPEAEANTISYPPASPSLHSSTLPLAPSVVSNRSIPRSSRYSGVSCNSPPVRTRLAASNESLHNMCASNIDSMSVILILGPMHEDLQRLKMLTPESLPRYSSRLRTKSYAQILKHRLLPIGQYIVAQLDLVSHQNQGALELKLCRFIAKEYWPLPVNDFTHLRVQEMYRNALFKLDQRDTNNQLSEPRLPTPKSA